MWYRRGDCDPTACALRPYLSLWSVKYLCFIVPLRAPGSEIRIQGKRRLPQSLIIRFREAPLAGEFSRFRLRNLVKRPTRYGGYEATIFNSAQKATRLCLKKEMRECSCSGRNDCHKISMTFNFTFSHLHILINREMCLRYISLSQLIARI